MRTFWNWLMGTIRPISLLAWLPPLAGAYLAGTPDGATVIAGLRAVLISGTANTLNNVVDRQADRCAGKQTLMVTNRRAGLRAALYIAATTALGLAWPDTSNTLAGILLIASALYSYVPNRCYFVKRLAVAVIVAATAWLDVDQVTAPLWWLTGLVGGVIFVRETLKDKPDYATDIRYKFAAAWEILRDWWCLTAPLLAPCIFLLSCWLSDVELGFVHAVAASGICLLVIGYMHVRARHGRYRLRFRNSTREGELALVCGLAGMLPACISPLVGFVAGWNTFSMAMRSRLTPRIMNQPLGRIHDAQLWGSLPLLALSFAGQPAPGLILLAAVIFSVTLAVSYQLYPNAAST